MKFSRHFVAIAIAVTDAANSRCVQLKIVPQGGPLTFVPNANAAGSDPAANATHCVAMGRMPDAAYAAIKAAGASHLLPSRWFSVSDDSGSDLGRCFASWDGSHIGEITTEDKCLTACGLQRKITPFKS